MAPPASTDSEEVAQASTLKEKPAKKAKKPPVEGMNSGVYNELEEKHFLEGLETYGRDWGKVTKIYSIHSLGPIFTLRSIASTTCCYQRFKFYQKSCPKAFY